MCKAFGCIFAESFVSSVSGVITLISDGHNYCVLNCIELPDNFWCQFAVVI